ncbi:STAS/SEC14 domain-containing protein [Marivirga harenae]|uniref:STAS/SEC14 domain-containing protein n=1 Tax=Marivirga harenae TaxID=2010992 RepID=UPI0026DFA6C5|nr:STAS/SEC14 domain-containing protein [Marivirga harenae]WKV13726.1 STAS/SEC14 domain-containing protein [Marivirga harenae]|tara:strand:+ start:6388 stop:6777 length:390 start_codon:yes stop_codon:yes gene_type:complete
MSTLVSQTKNVTIEEQIDVQAAMITFHGSLKSEDYRAAMLANYDLCQKSHIKNWLQNNADAGVLSLEDQKWVSESLIPKAAQEVEKIAVVVSKDVFRKFAAKNILDKQKGKLNFKYFDSLDDAKTWLKS